MLRGWWPLALWCWEALQGLEQGGDEGGFRVRCGVETGAIEGKETPRRLASQRGVGQACSWL